MHMYAQHCQNKKSGVIYFDVIITVKVRTDAFPLRFSFSVVSSSRVSSRLSRLFLSLNLCKNNLAQEPHPDEEPEQVAKVPPILRL